MLEMIPITQARREFLPLVKKMSAGSLKLAVTKQGKPIAVILSYDEYTRMAETVRVASSHKLSQDIERGLREIEQGQEVPLTDALNNE